MGDDDEDAQAELVERDAQADDDEEVEPVLDVRLELSHDDEDQEQDVHLSLNQPIVSSRKVLKYNYTSDEGNMSASTQKTKISPNSDKLVKPV